MISQADIIRTLVNKNCTDESIMSVALSPECTPAKLLEKINDAERFDLALDVSMKLGLDVSPIWKTWAIRCLKNRNFQGAREKLRHCFQRLRSTSARASLLCDILNELIPMSEIKMPLSEEIDLIKNARYRHPDSSVGAQVYPTRHCTIESKPKILEECLHYLKEYGTIEDSIKFFVKTSSWTRAATVLVRESIRMDVDKFYIAGVVLRASTTGRLDDLLDALIELDSKMVSTQKYYKAMYDYYATYKHYNSWYYLQNRIGDHIAAAENLIANFYLRRPTTNYRELNSRITKLSAASENYRCHIERLELVGSDSGSDNKLPDLFTIVNKEESEARQRKINTQIEITKNFAINEVPGCINNVKVVLAEDSATTGPRDSFDYTAPVTLFESDERRLTFLAALVLIYFDLDCTAYFSTTGLNLANQIVGDNKLDKINVFKTAMRIIIEDESCDIMANARLLLQRLTEDYIATFRRSRMKSNAKNQRKPSRLETSRQVTNIIENNSPIVASKGIQMPSSSQLVSNKNQTESLQTSLIGRAAKLNVNESARLLCDDVIRDSIRNCAEPDYRMKLTSLLSPEARIEQYIELGILSNAQRLAFDMKRRDYVAIVLREADRLNQDHIKDVCQHWLAKH